MGPPKIAKSPAKRATAKKAAAKKRAAPAKKAAARSSAPRAPTLTSQIAEIVANNKRGISVKAIATQLNRTEAKQNAQLKRTLKAMLDKNQLTNAKGKGLGGSLKIHPEESARAKAAAKKKRAAASAKKRAAAAAAKKRRRLKKKKKKKKKKA